MIVALRALRGLIVIPILVIIVTGVLVGIASYVHDVTHVKYHYSGETVLDAGQYREVLGVVYGDSTGYTDNINHIEYFNERLGAEGEGFVLRYELYSKVEIPYLDGEKATTAGMMWDLYAPVLSNGALMFIGVMLGIFGAVLITVIYRPKALPAFWQWLTDRVIRWRDRRFPEPVGRWNVVSSSDLDIDLPSVSGLVGLRKWNVNKHGILKSTAIGTEWAGNQLHAHKVPEKGDMNGIYGYCLGSPVDRGGRVTGIVELSGKFEYHPEGVVRAEYCRILGFFVSSAYQRLGRAISARYRVPVCFEDTLYGSYMEWLNSPAGVDALRHNAEILRGGRDG